MDSGAGNPSGSTGSKGKRAGCAPAYAAQGDADLCCHEVLLVHGHLLATRTTRFFSAELLSSWLPPGFAGAQGYSSPGARLCLSCAQLHNVPFGPPLQPLEVPVLEFTDCSP